jgi:hypothetical protein
MIKKNEKDFSYLFNKQSEISKKSLTFNQIKTRRSEF